MINIEEILIVNLTGAILMLILPRLRLQNATYGREGDRIYFTMSGVTLLALVVETLTFFIDGHTGTGMRLLSKVCNGYLFLATSAMGMLWVLYVDMNIYRSAERIRQRLLSVLIPFIGLSVLVVCDLFDAGILFIVTPDNIYIRGPYVYLSYAIVFLYYGYSIVTSVRAIRKTGHVFFPAHYFVLPCLVGTIVQGAHYGIVMGWFCAAVGLMIAQIQAQNYKAYVDDMSGLYNRRYYNYYVDRKARSGKCASLSGVMLDINDFKRINDNFGHMMGDDAICSMANILSDVTTEANTAFRLSGDEFVVISTNLSLRQTEQLVEDLQRRINAFNELGEKPYRLSVSIGYLVFDTKDFQSEEFFHQLDMKMYEAKAAYYSQAGVDRRARRS